MSTYAYPQSATIDHVDFKESARGTSRAYLHAKDGANPAMLQAIIQKLNGAGWQCIPYVENGEPALEVRGFKRAPQLATILADGGWVHGAPIILEDKGDRPGFMDKLKQRSLQASGALYVIGDYNFFHWGRKNASPLDMLGGVMYAAGTGSLLGYGRNDQSDTQIKDLSKQIMKHLIRESVKLPQSCAAEIIALEKKQSTLMDAHQFLKRYPSEMFNLFTGLAGACVAAAAFQHMGKYPKGHALKTAALLDIGLGTITMASTAIGGLIDEKAHDPDEPPSHGVQAVLDWVRERPLTIAGAGLMVSTLCHACSSYLTYRHGKRIGDHSLIDSTKNRAWFVASNLAAEFLIAISSKGHGKGVVSDTSVDDSVIALTAELIAKQPLKMQDQLVGMMADFLAKPDVLALKHTDVRQMLHGEVEKMRNNPWAAACTPLSAQDVPAWQARAMPPESAQLSLS